jgi:hypothetical protein
VYDVHVEGVGAVRTAEHFRLSGGRIASNILIFDEWPYQAARDAGDGAAQPPG